MQLQHVLWSTLSGGVAIYFQNENLKKPYECQAAPYSYCIN